MGPEPPILAAFSLKIQIGENSFRQLFGRTRLGTARERFDSTRATRQHRRRRAELVCRGTTRVNCANREAETLPSHLCNQSHCDCYQIRGDEGAPIMPQGPLVPRPG